MLRSTGEIEIQSWRTETEARTDHEEMTLAHSALRRVVFWVYSNSPTLAFIATVEASVDAGRC